MKEDEFRNGSTETEPDMVNHPPHYKSHPSGIECIQIVEHMPFNLGSAVKYIWRNEEKGNQIQDLKKAKWYIQREIERLEKNEEFRAPTMFKDKA
jgi:hypothetical protein